MSITRVAVIASFALLLAVYLLFTLAIQAVQAEERIPMTASWYGWEMCGSVCNPTASGVPFHPGNPGIAAHRTWPLGTVLHVCTWDMSRCIFTTILDRGPYNYSRDLDLSQSGFQLLAPLGAGIIRVQVLVVYGGEWHVKAIFEAVHGERAARQWLYEHTGR